MTIKEINEEFDKKFHSPIFMIGDNDVIKDIKSFYTTKIKELLKEIMPEKIKTCRRRHKVLAKNKDIACYYEKGKNEGFNQAITAIAERKIKIASILKK